jgi:hypothetical protein
MKFNFLTREIEMEGTEAFVESNFTMIQNLLVESYGVKEKMPSRKTKTRPNQEPMPFVKLEESQTETAKPGPSKTLSTLPATEPSVPEISRDSRAARPPLRKYIRRESILGHERTVVEVAGQKPKEISITSLKEKFGLSESKIEGIIRDAEKLGKVRKVMNGSYVWSQD